MNVQMIRFPHDTDWMEVKRRALVTVGKRPVTEPTLEWKRAMLDAEHSPIRYLQFSFLLEIPYWLSTEFSRHVHAQPYIRSQRNDRQDNYDRNEARQDAQVTMIWDMSAEELMTICHKRLCSKATREAQYIMTLIAQQVINTCPEFDGYLVPMCEYRGGRCHEVGGSCGRCEHV